MDFEIKDSGQRQQFASGMVRDVQDNKPDVELIFNGPMADRWAEHLTKGAKKYPDVELGVPNWTLAEGKAEMVRARKSAARHFRQWMRGDTDEDHAAATFFNINLYEYVKARLVQTITDTETLARWQRLPDIKELIKSVPFTEADKAASERLVKTTERRDASAALDADAVEHERASCDYCRAIDADAATMHPHEPEEKPRHKETSTHRCLDCDNLPDPPAHRFPVHPFMYRGPGFDKAK